ncbi:hypothetical protein Cri9333_4041 [Crinalium epipsammum PCC 9333]|uniref:Uncharacterized protein n=1 Tax=Crinalium epipsammum PCC 9333 TaxID=1173022 RepID=K9W3R1_9CYAN|nr:hypothetical protein Cri9333_4041 [Crinalium epipsammum PCC 9333]
MQDYQSGSINQQRLHQELNNWNPKLRFALRVSGLGLILLLLPIAAAVYNYCVGHITFKNPPFS